MFFILSPEVQIITNYKEGGGSDEQLLYLVN